MLLLFYITLTVYYVLVFMLPTVYKTVLDFVNEEINLTLYPSMLFVGVFLMLCILAFLITVFIKFHIGLILTNSTTIENMEEQQRKSTPAADNKRPPPTTKHYDIGIGQNIRQVFGKTPYLWFVPIYTQAGRPEGDGVIWPQRFKQAALRDEQVPSEMESHRTANPNNQ